MSPIILLHPNITPQLCITPSNYSTITNLQKQAGQTMNNNASSAALLGASVKSSLSASSAATSALAAAAAAQAAVAAAASNGTSNLGSNGSTTNMVANIKCEDGLIGGPPAKKMKIEPKEMVDMCVGTSVGTITEPDCLGPCEPGTSVTLEGIVWHETEGGVLVVNVTWRGKTYVGTLLDCTQHDWAPPRWVDKQKNKKKSIKHNTATIIPQRNDDDK